MKSRDRVLIVDDDENVGKALSRQLTKAGYFCATAADGHAGLEALKANDFDVALIDLEMPGMSGMELLSALRDSSVTTVLIILSGYGDIGRAVEATQLGAFDFIEKPSSSEVIESKVARAVVHRGAFLQARKMAGLVEQWEATFDAAPELIIVLDSEQRIMRCNRALALHRGVPKEDLMGRLCHESLCGEDHPAELCPFTRDMGESGFVSSECGIWGRPYEMTSAPLTDRSGKTWGSMHIARDITKRKRAEQTQARLVAILDATPDFVAFADAKDTHVLYINPAGRNMTGVGAQEDVTRLKIADVHPEWTNKLFRDEIIPAAIRDGVWTGECAFLNRDGREVPVMMVLLAHKSPSGEVERFSTISRDITDRKRAEQTLRDAYAQTERLLASISSILIGVDGNGTVTQWNTAAESTFGLLAAQTVGKRFEECAIPWDWEGVRKQLDVSLGCDKPTRLEEIRYTRTDAEAGILGLTVNRIATGTGGHSGFLILGADITQRKLLEAQLVQAHKLEGIGQLAAGIAHEINTPIQYVGDNTRFLQDSFSDLLAVLEQYDLLLRAAKAGTVDTALVRRVEESVSKRNVRYLIEEIPKAIQQSLEGIGRVAGIVRSMKEFSHPGSGKKTDIDINRAIENTVTVSRNEWKYVADMVTEFDASLPSVPCLPGEFNQVILNLIVNSAHAIADVVGDSPANKGRILIRTKADGDWVEISVSDTGSGIPASIQNKIFSPFFTTKEVGKGTGQGLAISRSVVVDKHGGTIRFDSQEGGGTTFIIRLPLHPENQERWRDKNHEKNPLC